MTRAAPSIQVQVMSPIDAPGGGAVHARGVARALRERGANVSVLCTGGPGRRETQDCGTVIACRPTNWPLIWRWPPLGTLGYWIKRIRATVRPCDGIVSLSPVMAVASRVAAPEIPVLYCPAALHVCERRASKPNLLERCERRAFRTATAVLFPASEVRDEVLTRGIRPRGRTGVCALGIDADRMASANESRATLGVPDDAFVLLTVGAINANKGQRIIARALAAAASSNWWWIIAGDGPQREEVAAELRGAAMAERTIFAGNLGNVGDLYAASDVLVAASRCETFSLACAEALWAGVPVVLPENKPGSVLSPLAETVVEHGLGFTFDREDAVSLGCVLVELGRRDAQRAEIGGRAREFARDHFSWSRYADCTLELLRLQDPLARERSHAPANASVRDVSSIRR